MAHMPIIDDFDYNEISEKQGHYIHIINLRHFVTSGHTAPPHRDLYKNIMIYNDFFRQL